MFARVQERIKSIKKNKTHLQINDQTFTKTILVTQFPSQVEPGFLSFLTHIRALHPDVYIRRVYTYQPGTFKWNFWKRWKLNRLHSNIQEAEKTPEGPRESEVRAYRALKSLQSQDGNPVADLWLYITVSAPTEDALERTVKDIRKALKNRQLKTDELKAEQTPAFLHSSAFAPTRSEFLKRHKGRLTDMESAASTMPFTSGSLSDETGMYAGHRVSDDSIVYFDMDNPHYEGDLNIIVLGKTGEGKSNLMKAYTMGLLLEGYRAFVFDVDGEWKAMCQYVGGLWIDQTMSSGRYNDPFRIPKKLEGEDPEILEANHARLSEVMSAVLGSVTLLAGEGITSEMINAADRAMTKVWKECGIDPDRPETWDTDEAKKASIHLWYSFLKQDESRGAKELAEKVWRFFEGSLKKMFSIEEELQIENYSLVVYHVASQINNTDDQHAGAVKMSMAMNTVWGQVRLEKTLGQRFTAVVVDEGQRALVNPAMSAFVNMIATTIRKWNGLIMLGLNKPSVLWETGGTSGGNGLWENSSIKIMFYMEDSGLKSVAEHADVPQNIIDELRTMMGTRQFMIRYKDKGYDRLTLRIPEKERKLYKTRGKKTA
ncbi:VirB4 family type IV secretion system protein [Aneurinibacillus terranovensis]|uniref:VirB4 family type IV secretion system protein n=1 Tax=Aneurinibacillus terranovensis TaxID=278991 RepID=UPI00040C58EE|nr:DUF87 domain-containing protein [Aneurinibacillus terranovensis]